MTHPEPAAGRSALRAFTVLAVAAIVATAGVALTARVGAGLRWRWATATPSVESILGSTPARVWGEQARGSVVAIAAHRPWMRDAVGVPTALWHDGRVLMYFGGVEPTDDAYVARVRVGVAESADGLHFRLANGGEPVFAEAGAGAFDSHSVNHPFVLEVGGQLWMYYAGADGTKGANSARVERLGLARSEDGITWQRDPRPVMDLGAAGEIDSTQVASPCVLRTPDGFRMWYGAYDGHHRIAYATSADGLRWVRHGAVHGLRGADSGELGPSVYFDGRRYLILYNSVDASAQQWKLYAATSDDGMNWTPAYDGRTVIEDAPAWTFAVAGRGRNSAVHLSQLIMVRGRLLAYYMAEDEHSLQRIGALVFR